MWDWKYVLMFICLKPSRETPEGYKGAFWGEEVHTLFFPSIRQQEALQKIKLGSLARQEVLVLSFPVLSHLWHLRVACQCPDSCISWPGMCIFSYCHAGCWAETALNEKLMRKHFVCLPIMGRSTTILQRCRRMCHLSGHFTASVHSQLISRSGQKLQKSEEQPLAQEELEQWRFCGDVPWECTKFPWLRGGWRQLCESCLKPRMGEKIFCSRGCCAGGCFVMGRGDHCSSFYLLRAWSWPERQRQSYVCLAVWEPLPWLLLGNVSSFCGLQGVCSLWPPNRACLTSSGELLFLVPRQNLGREKLFVT